MLCQPVNCTHLLHHFELCQGQSRQSVYNIDLALSHVDVTRL